MGFPISVLNLWRLNSCQGSFWVSVCIEIGVSMQGFCNDSYFVVVAVRVIL